MIVLALNLARVLAAQTMAENIDANLDYERAVRGDHYYDGGVVHLCPDTAWERCKRTAMLADLASDFLADVEDEL